MREEGWEEREGGRGKGKQREERQYGKRQRGGEWKRFD